MKTWQPVVSVQVVDATERFRDWTRSEEGARVCMGVAQGQLGDEHAIIKAFLDAIDPDKEHTP